MPPLFLTKHRQEQKRPLNPDEVFCLSCKSPRKVLENLVQLDRVQGKQTRITGFFANCEGSVSCVFGEAQIDQLDRYCEVTGNKDEAA